MGIGFHLGQKVTREFVLESELVESFANLVQDHAPVHFSALHASSLGFGRPIVHGFLLGSLFSGVLGEVLPGPESVIARLDLRFRRPVYVGDGVFVSVEVASLSVATGSVKLRLSLNHGNQVAVDGTATCVIPGGLA